MEEIYIKEEPSDRFFNENCEAELNECTEDITDEKVEDEIFQTEQHSTGVTGQTCYHSEVKTYHVNNMKVHVITQTIGKISECEQCNAGNSAAVEAGKELLVEQKEDVAHGTTIECTVCNCLTEDIVEHMKVHETSYKCDQCEYSITNKYLYERHMRRHYGERLFSCTVCNYRARSRKTLTKHMLCHSIDRPYACKYCQYRSNSQYILDRHIMTHTNKRPHKCKNCEYSARDMSTLNIHMQKSCGKLGCLCNICGFRAATQLVLSRHMSAHKNETLHFASLQ